jgi:hypothetical protein
MSAKRGDGDRGGDGRPPQKHPRLSKREDAAQRGEDPPESVGAPATPDFADENPEWQPDPGVTDPWRKLIAEHGREHRPNREDVLPYLLIRGFAPGDRARRPMWPPRPSWLSPDILLIDATWTGPFRADKVVGSPTAGRTYRVFVHVWNLGLLAAAGVHVRAWHVNPGFFGGPVGVYVPELIGGTFVDLAPRTAPGAHRVVEIVPAWSIPRRLTGHECLLAAADCPADRWNGVLDANADRHVGQRNIAILEGDQDLAPLLKQLGAVLGSRESLELTIELGEEPRALWFGPPIERGQHLLVATRQGDRLLVVPTAQLAELLGRGVLEGLSRPGTAAMLFSRWAGRHRDRLEPTSIEHTLGRMLDAPDLRARTVAAAFGISGPATVHLAAFDQKGQPTGGYSLRVAAGGLRD